jgi:hypothetical protein
MIHQADKILKERWKSIFNSLPVDSRIALKTALCELREDALAKSSHCWRRHKAPMALYWKVVGVYAGHIARAIEATTLSTTGKP